MDQDTIEIIFTVNGPGELVGIVTPLIKAFKNAYKNIRYTLYTVPCQFSSGLETETAKSTGLFDYVFSVKEYKNFWFKKIFPESYRPLKKGFVFYSGGDSMHALIIAGRYGFDAYAYDEGNLTNKGKFKRIFTRDLDGDLMVDAAKERTIKYQAVPIGSDKMTIGLYPGSRPQHLDIMIPFLSNVAKILKNKHPNLNFTWGINKNIKELFVTKYGSAVFNAPMETEGTAYDLIISLTGTNTAISATLGIPMVVLLPFNDPKLIPFMGLFGLIAEIPVLGYWLKYLAVRVIAKRMPLISIPNIKARRKIVPELKGILTETEVADAAENLLININERERIHHELQIFMGKPGAQNIVRYFAKILS